jgi:hypothetical protein
MAKPSAKDLEALWEASEGILQLEKQYRSLKARLDSVGQKLQEAREEVKPIIEKLGEDRFGLLGETVAMAKTVIGEDETRAPRGELQPAILEVVENAEEGLTMAAIIAGVSDRLGRPASEGSVRQAVSGMVKNKAIRRTGTRRNSLYWPAKEGEVTIRPGEELDKEAQQRIAELRTEGA